MDEPPSHAASGLRASFLRERPALLRLLVARLGTVAEAEDALQDVWLKLDEDAGGPIASPTAYIFRMAYNVALDRRRSVLAQSVREAHWLAAQPGAAEHPGAEEALLARQRLAQVEAALSRLPDRVARAFRMFRLEGLPQKQIAEEMGLSLSGLEKLLQRAYREIHDARHESAAVLPLWRRHDSEEDSR